MVPLRQVLSDGKLHRVTHETGVRGQIGLGFNLCVTPPHNHIVFISRSWIYRVWSCVTTVRPCPLWTSGQTPDPPSLVLIALIQHHSPWTPYWSSILSILYPCPYLHPCTSLPRDSHCSLAPNHYCPSLVPLHMQPCIP